ncbi:MAG TPA: maleylpyruvate isomerase family mycothiol-dependent enzyme [Chloroflexota bacterium]|nr:maleylpyruvate isomerase family mycothiol-dependent enzyme [Chloroflexota bacterium]
MAAHPDVTESLRLLADLTARVRAELAALPAAAWDAPSNCPPWPVRRLAAHLVENALFVRENVERGVAGSQEPAVTREERAARVEALAAAPPAELLAALDRYSADLAALFERLSADELERICYHPAGNRSARWYAQQRLAEVAFHRWDLLRSVGQETALDDAVARFLLPMLVESNLPRIYARGPKGHARLTLAATDAPALRWTLTATPEGLAVQPGDDAAEATLLGPAAHLALLIYGRARLPDELAAGRIRVEGDQAVAERFFALLPGA